MPAPAQLSRHVRRRPEAPRIPRPGGAGSALSLSPPARLSASLFPSSPASAPAARAFLPRALPERFSAAATRPPPPAKTPFPETALPILSRPGSAGSAHALLPRPQGVPSSLLSLLRPRAASSCREETAFLDPFRCFSPSPFPSALRNTPESFPCGPFTTCAHLPCSSQDCGNLRPAPFPGAGQGRRHPCFFLPH